MGRSTRIQQRLENVGGGGTKGQREGMTLQIGISSRSIQKHLVPSMTPQCFCYAPRYVKSVFSKRQKAEGGQGMCHRAAVATQEISFCVLLGLGNVLKVTESFFGCEPFMTMLLVGFPSLESRILLPLMVPLKQKATCCKPKGCVLLRSLVEAVKLEHKV